MQILLAILALSFLIIVHEFGHFIVAKLSGIKVHEFALFMGPKLISKQFGETTYSLRLVPLGGFVRMEGEEQESEDARAFNRKPIYIRAAVIAAGPIMNLLFAILIITIIVSKMGFTTTVVDELGKNSTAAAQGLQAGDRLVQFNNKPIYHPMDVEMFFYAFKGEKVELEVIRNGNPEKFSVPLQKTSYRLGFGPKDDTNTVIAVAKESPAEKAGLKANDIITKLNSVKVNSRQEISNYLNQNKENPVKITVSRNGKDETLKPVQAKEERNAALPSMGIEFQVKKGGFFESVQQSVIYSFSVARSVFYSVIWLVTGSVSLKDMMGPVGIVTTIGDVVEQSPTFMYKLFGLLNITAFISINLGVFNLIPFPALDGSKLLLLGIEGIRRKAIPPEKEAIISMVGLTLLIMLMLFATYNDIVRTIFGG
jgi:regulator of sigma E protease